MQAAPAPPPSQTPKPTPIIPPVAASGTPVPIKPTPTTPPTQTPTTTPIKPEASKKTEQCILNCISIKNKAGKDDDDTRETIIRTALNNVLARPNLSKYTMREAVGATASRIVGMFKPTGVGGKMRHRTRTNKKGGKMRHRTRTNKKGKNKKSKTRHTR